MTQDSCSECARLNLRFSQAGKDKADARKQFEQQHTVGGAQERATRYRSAADAFDVARAELAQHKATHTW